MSIYILKISRCIATARERIPGSNSKLCDRGERAQPTKRQFER
ncbi:MULTISPECIES: hypothetical protein [Photorhabdus]|nr:MULTISPECIES: hypothetical protein [Photorhabdus]